MGSDPTANTVALDVQGMNCASCVSHVETAINKIPGVTNVVVNLATETATVAYLDSEIQPAEITTALTQSGYPATQQNHTDGKATGNHSKRAAELKRLTLLAAALAIPVFILEMGSHLFPVFRDFIATTIGTRNSHLIQFALTTLVLLGPGMVFFKKGFPLLFKGRPEMNSLVALGTTAAYGFSVVSLFFPSLLPADTANVYFESAAIIVLLILLGRYLEARAKGRTGQAIQKLMKLQPDTATIIRDDKQVEVKVESIAPGDIVQLKPGEKVAVDGEVTSGSTYIDESMLSGEPVPVKKTNGSEVVAGSINQNGTIQFKATSVGADTTLSHIIKMVESAQSAKLPIQETVNRVTGVFVPAVLLIASVTFIIWLLIGPAPTLGFALVAAISVLIVACPCAMGLATPTSIMVGTGAAAEQGIFFRQGEALQSLQKSTVFAFDKTGILTKGLPELTETVVMPGFDKDQVIKLAASVETASEHPVANAFVSLATKNEWQLAPVQNFNSHTGYGVSGSVEGKQVLIGSARLMERQSVVIQPQDESNPALSICIAIDGKLAAKVEISDPIKSDSKQVIQSLTQSGISTVMITGDDNATAEKVAQELGIKQVIAQVLPGEKLDAVKSLQANGAHVAYIGDGINDAPALAAADVGISVGTGTDVAIEAADVVLMSDNLTGVLRARETSKKTMRNIKQNLFWAFGYNILLIPIAAGLLYPFAKIMLSPMLAAAAMALSSVFVVSNALRLRYRRPEGSGSTSV